MATKNLGQVSAIHIGTSAPTNKNLIWRDLSASPNLWKIWNSQTNLWETVPSEIAQSITANLIFDNETAIQNILGYKNNDTVIDKATDIVYRFSSISVATPVTNLIIKPTNIVSGAGRWIKSFSFIEEAPIDGVQYVRQDGGWVTLDADDIDDTATTNKFVTATEKSYIVAATAHIDGVDEAKHGANQIVNADALPNLGLAAGQKQSDINAAIPAPGGGSYTYAQLLALKTAGSLTRGIQYELNDYYTKHLIPNSSPAEINTGTLEPLLLTAISNNEFHVEAKSTIYPSDIIHYRFDDDSCEDGTRDVENKKWTGGTARPGLINYRKSTTNNLEVHNDWRNYKVRRWDITVPDWVSGGDYTKRQLVKYNYGHYIATTTHTGVIETPKNDSVNWMSYGDVINGHILTYTPNILTAILPYIPVGLTVGEYYDYKIFGDYDFSSGDYKDITISRFDYDEFLDYFGFAELENNLIVKGSNIVIGKNSTGNTVSGENSKIDSFFCFNDMNVKESTIKSKFINNHARSFFFGNNITVELCIGNIFGKQCIGNTINGYYFLVNTGDIETFSGNIIGSSWQNNDVCDIFTGNIIGGNNCNTHYKERFVNNIVLGGFNDNEILAPVSDTDFTAATHVYGNYNCTIFKNAAGVARLSYYDANDQLIITDITA